MQVDIPGYVYFGDMGSVADYGGVWIGVGAETLGHVIECIGADALGGSTAEVRVAPMYVSGHTAMREAMTIAGWRRDHTLHGPTNRDMRRAMLLRAYFDAWGFGTTPDHTEDVDADAPDADQQVIDIANRFAR